MTGLVPAIHVLLAALLLRHGCPAGGGLRCTNLPYGTNPLLRAVTRAILRGARDNV
jgi:hypothetical protein